MTMNKIRAAVMASRGIPETATDAQIRFIWNMFTPEMQKQYMDKIGDQKNATHIDSGKVQGRAKRTRGDGKSSDVSVPVS